MAKKRRYQALTWSASPALRRRLARVVARSGLGRTRIVNDALEPHLAELERKYGLVGDEDGQTGNARAPEDAPARQAS